MDTRNSTWSRRITQLVVVAAAAGAVSAGMTATASATEQASSATASSASYTVEEYIGFVAADADRYWTTWFTSNGYREPFVELAVIPPGGSYASDCSGLGVITSSHPNAYYCPADGDGVTWNGQLLPDDQGALILPVVTMQQMWTGNIFGKPSAVAGDFAAAVLIAHEFGHHVQDEWLQQHNAGRTDGTVLPAPNDKWDELIADCFAGNWVRSAYDRGILEPGDIEEAIAALEVLGDTAPSRYPHGSGPERRAALERGITTGSPTDCASSYWVVDPNGQP